MRGIRGGRPLRTMKPDREVTARRRASGGAATKKLKREPVAFDWDDAIVRLRMMLDNLEEGK